MALFNSSESNLRDMPYHTYEVWFGFLQSIILSWTIKFPEFYFEADRKILARDHQMRGNFFFPIFSQEFSATDERK
jgi:hypothetical protein